MKSNSSKAMKKVTILPYPSDQKALGAYTQYTDIMRSSLILVLVVKTAAAFSAMSMTGSASKIKSFTFGAGCFWAPADKIKKKDGILSTSVGYCGDDSISSTPNYEYVCSGRTKLVEAVRVEYDSEKLSFDDLLNMFDEVNTAEWGNKRQYEGVIFTQSDEEAQIAASFLQNNRKVVAKVEPMSKVYFKAENYHQDYWAKWRTRIPLLILTLAVGGKFGGDYSQTIYNTICYAFIGFTLLERKFDTNVDKVIVGKD